MDSRVESAGVQQRTNCLHHSLEGDLADPPGRLGRVQPERATNPLTGLPGRVHVQPDVAAEEVTRIQVTEHDESIGDGRLSPTLSVAGRTRNRTSRMWAHAQHVSGVDPSDRPTPGADRLDVDQWAARSRCPSILPASAWKADRER